MLEYTTFCYLQNQKTGCTFVESFLRDCAAEPLVAYDKHAAALRRDPAKFYFINVREPLALYRSLFAYGLDGKGTVFMRLKGLGHEHLYAQGPAGFSKWLRFVLDPAHSTMLANEYVPAVARLMGLMTWRFTRLAVFGFEKAAPAFASRPEVGAFVQANYFMNAVLKQELLREGLAELVRGPLASRVKSVPDALEWIRAAPRINVSESITDQDEVPVDAEVLALLFDKERRLYRSFYPDAAGFAAWRETVKGA